MTLNIPLGVLPGLNPLVLKYAEDHAAVAHWFDYDPHDGSAISRRLYNLKQDWDAAPERLAGRQTTAVAISNQLRSAGAGPRALAAAESLGQAGTYVIATGQQAGLFGGPLYTVLKAVSAIKLARQLSREHPTCRFVPVFWIAASDSDFDEVRRTWVLGPASGLEELSLPPALAGQDGMMIGARPPEPELPRLLDRLAEILPPGLYRDDTIDLVRDAYSSGRLAEGFTRLMAGLFRDTELVLVEPQDPALMAKAAPVITAELENAAAISAAVRVRNEEITAAGYRLQVDHGAGDTGLFLLTAAGRRDRIALAGDGGFQLRRSGSQLSLGELTDLARETPQRFVPDVALRPVYENTLLPVAAFIGGAAEITYRAQFTALFHAHGQRMAPAFLRATATLMTPRLVKSLSDLRLGLSDCHVPPSDFETLVFSGRRPEQLVTGLADYRRTVANADAGIQELAVKIDPGLERVFTTLRANLDRHIDKLDKKVIAALKRRDAALLSQVRHLQANTYPRQNLPERVLSIVSFLPRTGSGIIEKLLCRLEFPSWEHQVITLE